MKLLEDAILTRGRVKDGDVLKVDAFLNHQMDVPLINEIGKEFYRLYQGQGVNKILTIEASGIGIACITAQHFGVPGLCEKDPVAQHRRPGLYQQSYLVHPPAGI